MSGRLGDRGSVTAELAVALPAVLLLIALCVGALSAASRQVRLQDAVADAARLVARGEDEGSALALATAAVSGASAQALRDGELVCVHATALAGPALPGVRLAADACALDGGR